MSYQIYLIGAACHPGRYKIGYSENVEVRLKNGLQPWSPCELAVISAFRVLHPKYEEENLHMVFHDKRLHGEWFDLTDADVAWFVDISAMGIPERRRAVQARLSEVVQNA